jgi:hypothetical protein
MSRPVRRRRRWHQRFLVISPPALQETVVQPVTEASPWITPWLTSPPRRASDASLASLMQVCRHIPAAEMGRRGAVRAGSSRPGSMGRVGRGRSHGSQGWRCGPQGAIQRRGLGPDGQAPHTAATARHRLRRPFAGEGNGRCGPQRATRAPSRSMSDPPLWARLVSDPAGPRLGLGACAGAPR